MKNRGNSIFILLGPFNTYIITDESRVLFFAMMEAVKKELDELGYPYFDSTCDLLPSEEYTDQFHALKNGHAFLAKAMVGDTKFKQLLSGLK